MAKRTSRKSAKVAPGAAARRVAAGQAGAASARIDARIAELGDWRGRTLRAARRIIVRAHPGIVEEWKWQTPVWSCNGIICTGETYKNVVKLTFARGAALTDPARLFNSSLAGKVRRAIDIRQGHELDEAALAELVRAAAELNVKRDAAPPAAKPKLLSGGNPQIAKGDGDAPVQAYIDAMPGWKRAVGRRLDAIVSRTVPGVRKAVRWNTPFYGVAGRGWFLGFHCMTKYIKVAFFRGAALRPPPPVASRQKGVRYVHVHEDDPIDEALLARWIRQASELPGEKLF